jgi:RNA recognition motif-containing protein
MKEGRMRGQAFVTFQDEELAEEALEEVNGFKLHDKPMIIVCFF